jgi:2'-5' RNA ligase
MISFEIFDVLVVKEMKRLFIAIKIRPDKDFLDQFFQLKAHLRHERIKWVEEHNIHITLKFLGDTEVKKIAEIENVLKHVAIKHSAFSIQLKNLGIFGSRYDPRVIWVGIEPYDHLVSLMKDVHAELKTIGYEPDRQNLVPHLTIGRIRELRDGQVFQTVIEKFSGITSQEMMVKECILYESILKKEGPAYISQAVVPFASFPS